MNAHFPMAAVTSDLEASVDSLHPDWREEWAPRIPAGLRRAMSANPRLATRIGGLCAAVAGAPRISPRVLRDQDVRAYRTYFRDPSRVVEVAGLIWHANALAQIVKGSELRLIATNVSPSNIGIALRLRALAPKAREASIDPDRFALAVVTSGQRCVRAWSNQLADSLRARVLLTLPRIIGSSGPVDYELERLAPPIVDAALEEVKKGEM